MHSVLERYYEIQAEYLDSVQATYSPDVSGAVLQRHALDGALKMVDALCLDACLQAARPPRILEVGSFLGFSTRWLLECSRGWRAAVTAVDPGLRHRMFDDPHRHLHRFCGEAGRLQVTEACLSAKNEAMFMHDYLNYDPKLTPRDALARMDGVPVLSEPFGAFDFALIDGDHSFDATAADVRLVAQMMPQGGTIVVHDAFSFPDVVPALREVCGSTPGLAFAGIAGVGFHTGIDRMAALTGRDGVAVKAPLSDGLGLVAVAPTPGLSARWES